MTTPQEKIQAILDKCSTGKYIFRGENKEYGKVSSGLYRQYCQRDDSKPVNDSNPTTNDPLIDNEHFFVSSVEQDIVEKVRQHIRPNALNIEVLTELQHYGGKTALLDFSKDLHIALFFACDGNFDKNGRVILFKTSELTESTDIDYNQIDTTKHTLISPIGKNPRVIFQSSIFVHSPKGYLEVCENDIIEIENDLKEPLLDYLSKYFNINTETIYNDIQGFIRNQHNHSTAEVEFYRGVANSDLDKYKEAITNYDKAIELNPQLAIAYNNRGYANTNLGNHEATIIDYNKAIELNPQLSEAYNNRGNANCDLGNPEDAIEDYDKAIEIDPKDVSAYYNRGAASSNLGNPTEAIEDYNKAIEIDPQYADAYNNRGLAKSNLGDFKEAIEDYNKAVEINPHLAIVYDNRGLAKSALGEPEKAIEDYDKAIKLNSKDAETYCNRGLAKSNLGDFKEAIEDYNKAIELDPQYVYAYNNRGLAKSNLGDHEEAIEDYNKTIELNPQLSEAYSNRGLAKSALGEPKKAIEDYDKAIKLNPQHGYAYYNRGATNATLKNYKEAKIDCANAKTLFAKAENMEMVEECEGVIARLQKLITPQ